MIFRRLELKAVRLPLRPFVSAAGTLEAREGFLVFAGGGVGEALPLPSSGTETLAACQAALERFEGGEARTPEEVDALLEGIAAPCARFGIETALLDALARERGVSLARLLSPSAREAVAVNAIIDLRSGTIPPGFRSFKVKVGAPDDLQRVRRVREAIGPDAELRLDANGAWNLPTAIELLRELEAVNPSYCEDPLPAPDGALRAHTRVPIAADAWLADPAMRQRVLDERLADVLVVKPAVIGGLVRAQRLAHSGLPVVVTTMLEGVVGRLAALHLAAALPSQRAAGLATAQLLAADHADDPAPMRGGLMHVPAAPGLGVDPFTLSEGRRPESKGAGLSAIVRDGRSAGHERPSTAAFGLRSGQTGEVDS